MKKLITAGIFLSLAPLPALAQAQQPASNEPAAPQSVDITSTTEAVGIWVDLRKDISKAKNEWRVARELLKQQIELYRSELTTLEDQIQGLASRVNSGGAERAQLAERQENLERALAVVQGKLPAYERRVLQLAEYFPPPLKRRLESMTSRIPRDGRAAAGSSAGNRMATVIAILNEVDKFNAEVTVEADTRQIGGETREVQVMYLGLAQAFFVDEEGQFGGIGTPAKGQWNWQEVDSATAAEILIAVKVANNVIKPAQFANLPLKLTDIQIGR